MFYQRADKCAHRWVFVKKKVILFPSDLVTFCSSLFLGSSAHIFQLRTGYLCFLLAVSGSFWWEGLCGFSAQSQLLHENHSIGQMGIAEKLLCWQVLATPASQATTVTYRRFCAFFPSLLWSERLKASSAKEPGHQIKTGPRHCAPVGPEDVGVGLVVVFHSSVVWKSQLKGHEQALSRWCLQMIVHAWLQAPACKAKDSVSFPQSGAVL